MSEEDPKGESGMTDRKQADARESGGAVKEPKKSREDRLAEALRANLRRRKSAAKTRKQG